MANIPRKYPRFLQPLNMQCLIQRKETNNQLKILKLQYREQWSLHVPT